MQRTADQLVFDALSFSRDPGDTGLRLQLFAWLVASGRLELRFAFPEHVEDPGIFHEKIGIFDFPWGDSVAFTGSANETISGHTRNFESVDVFRRWLPEERARVDFKIQQFEDAWSSRAPGLHVLALSSAALERVRLIAPEMPSAFRRTKKAEGPEAKLWPHQESAIKKFLDQRRGILEMATGTGKTRTALEIAITLLRAKSIDTIVLAADGTDLLDQWGSQLLALARSSPTPLALLRHYAGHHERERFTRNPSGKILAASRQALPPALRALKPGVAARTLLIHDEVHRLGSPSNRRDLAGLSEAIPYRLGLSATPEREYDQEGSEFIKRHVGPVIERFGLAEAIQAGILTPFVYFPLDYTPTAEDRQRIQKVHAACAASRHAGRPMSPEDVAMQIARVYKTSRAKVPVFADFIAARPELLRRCIVFCETKEFGEEILQIVHRHRADFHTYFAEEDSETLRRFAAAELECLITCHRLSEGIDIKSLENVILFSSSRSPLETIQRMGRCFRIDPSNPSKVANVVDFVRTHAPRERDGGDDDTADDERKRWLTELSEVRPVRS